MQRSFLVIFLFVCQAVAGQSLTTCLQLFDKADKENVKASFQNEGYQLIQETDSLDLQLLHYSIVKTQNGVQPHTYLFLSDSAVEYLSFEIYDLNSYKSFISQLKAQHFQMLNADVNGNFITTVYDNDRFLLSQDYEAIENPLGKGQIPYYRYRIYRKYGKFDEMNGEKTVLFTENGMSYTGIRENYKNGVLSGERTFYYPDGIIKRKENYQAGRLNGLASDFDREGKLTHSVTHSYHWKYGMEKWYNAEGKVVKTLQWQRDVPVGMEKQTFNGTIVQNIPYVKGVKQGLAKVAVYADPYVQFFRALDTLNDAPIAIETVNYNNGLKNGKAICIYFNSTDTVYVGYYKAGKLDSIYSHYGQGNTAYTTNYTNGLENGERIYPIPSGPLKDIIYKIEQYKNGKLDGLVEQFYRKGNDELLQDPDPGFHLQGSNSGYPKTVLGGWTHSYSFETYKDGLRNGSFSFQEDSMNYNKGNYVNGKLDGLQEASMILGGKQIKTTRYYDMDAKFGEWVTDYVSDSIVMIEHYWGNQKHGFETKVVKGELVEKRFYIENNLEDLVFFDSGIESCVLHIQNETEEFVVLHQTLKNKDTTQFFIYLVHKHDFPKSDTLLAILSADLKDAESFVQYLNGTFKIETNDYERSGILLGHSIKGTELIRYKEEGITESIEFENGEPATTIYTTSDEQPYSGIFTSPYSNETISVKDGLRNGWCIEYDASGKEIRRTKYSKGVAKKMLVLSGM